MVKTLNCLIFLNILMPTLCYVLCRQSHYADYPEKIKVGTKKFFIQRAFIANFSEAEKSCVESGAELASFDNKSEFKAVKEYIKTLKVLPPKKDYAVYNWADLRFWLSAVKYKNTEKFVWLPTRRFVNLNKWAPGEPNNSLDGENCMEMWSNYQFNDWFCYELNYFICQCYTVHMPKKKSYYKQIPLNDMKELRKKIK